MNIPAGLYVHVPFCRAKCPYCGFFSVPSSAMIPRWTAAIKKEMLLYKHAFKGFDTIYFGGGTPTLLDAASLADTMDHIRAHFDIAVDAEITIEANPCDLTPDKSKGLKAMGFNRISLGVQSFDDNVLAFLGRAHTAHQAEAAIRRLRSAGFENISLDLIFGFHEQPVSPWIKTVERAVSFEPEHLSCYQLSFEKNTVFKQRLDAGRIRQISDRDAHAFFMATSRFLQKAGYHHYEVSSFARKMALTSRHNQKYWHHKPYLGLGPSAHSFSRNKRWWNVRSVRGYCDALERAEPPVAGMEDLSEEELRFESIFLGLRTMAGFDRDHVAAETKPALYRFSNSGLLTLHRDRVVPTRKGLAVADYLACELS